MSVHFLSSRRVFTACGMVLGGLFLCPTYSVAAPTNTAPTPKKITPSRVSVPQVSEPIVVTDKSWPWAAADRALGPVDLAKVGYVEQEYIVSGRARVLGWPARGQLTTLASGPYVTRILVNRPRDPAKFSGSVVIEPLNPSIRYDLPLMWGAMHEAIIRRGDIWVGVTVKPVAIQSLKEFDPIRYASLGFPNPLPLSQTCAQDKLPMPRGGLPVESSPKTENGFIWDVLAQVGALVKDHGTSGPLKGFDVTRLYMVGDSQSGAFVLTYANAIQHFALGADGKPLYDGFLAAVSTGPGTPINQCALQIPTGDSRTRIGPVGVPIITMVSGSEINSLRRRPDSDIAPDLYRGYEIAGASHVHEDDGSGAPSPLDAARTSGAKFDTAGHCHEDTMPGNTVPFDALLRGALINLDRWSRGGTTPPHGAPLRVTNPGQPDAIVELDRFGNAMGGVRTPAVDVPTARYYSRMTGPGICELWGYRRPFAPDVLRSLYPTHEDYVSKVQADVRRLETERWIDQVDGEQIVAAAKADTKVQ